MAVCPCWRRRMRWRKSSIPAKWAALSTRRLVDVRYVELQTQFTLPGVTGRKNIVPDRISQAFLLHSLFMRTMSRTNKKQEITTINTSVAIHGSSNVILPKCTNVLLLSLSLTTKVNLVPLLSSHASHVYFRLDRQLPFTSSSLTVAVLGGCDCFQYFSIHDRE